MTGEPGWMNKMPLRNRAVLGLLLLLAAVAFAGCRGGRKLAEVTGKVTYNGKPLEIHGCQIAFMSAETKVFLGVTLKDDGTYRVRMAEGYGLPPGTYKVAIHLPPGYNPPDSKDTVEAGKLVEKNIELGKKYIPQKYRSPETSGLVLELSPGGAEFNVEMVDEAKK